MTTLKNPPDSCGEHGGGLFFLSPQSSSLLLLIDNVELVLKAISNQHSIESEDNDQPDYDSVASDEDADLEAAASKAHRQKVRGHTARETGLLCRISFPAQLPYL